VNDPYTAGELEQIRTQAVWFASDVGCPRDGSRMRVAKTFVFQELLHKTLDGWPPLAGWEREGVELRCYECRHNVRVRTGPALQRAWANMLAKVLEGVKQRGRDSRLVGSDLRALQVTIEQKFAASISWADLAIPAETLAARVLDQYDRGVSGT
jgi:hypothetical protein